MTALTDDRDTPQAAGDRGSGKAAASQMIYAGALVMRNASGYLVAGTEAADLVGVGRAERRVNNSAGADGDQLVPFREGTFRFANAGGADLITITEIGSPCFAVDDQSVAKTSDSGGRSKAGIVMGVDTAGVWVRLDEALTRATD